MSAATMVACAANQIVMGKHSFLGPIDPQLILQTALGNRLVPVSEHS
jgi:ClpP class serine protease